jgi:CrcB protein
VNVAGSFCFGLIYGACRDRSPLPAGLETVVLVGLLGGFTTFSSFAWQSLEMGIGGRPVIAAGYVMLTNAAALAAAWAGLAAGTRWGAGPS